jgi:integrase
MNRRSMQRIVAEAGKRAGLDQLDPPVVVIPHILRHTYVYLLSQAGMSLEARAGMSSLDPDGSEVWSPEGQGVGTRRGGTQ